MKLMKKIADRYNSISLILRILTGLILGAVLALLVPQATVIGETR